MNMRITNPRRITLGLTAIVFAICGTAFADTETWPFDLQTSGGNVYHASSTAVCNTSPLYDGAYEITLLEVEVSYIGITFGPFDVTDQIPPEGASGGDIYEGPPPFEIYSGAVRYPDPPEPATVEADIVINVDDDGYGHVSVVDITLGTAEIDLGFPFGIVTVQIESVRVAGTVWLTPLVPTDFDGDGDVDLSDLAIVLGNYGITSGAAYEDGDANGDGAVNLSDLAELLGQYGQWDC